MNPEIKVQWVAALRSGKYRQGAGVLHRRKPAGDEYCCLGVLCELAVRAGVANVEPARYDGDSFVYGAGDRYSSTYLPLVVREWAGLADRPDARNPLVKGHHTLADLNDNLSTFREIANLIEEKL